MRASVAYRIAYGDDASTTTAAHPIHTRSGRAAASRRPANQAAGSVATEITPESARTATSPDPKISIHPWSRT